MLILTRKRDEAILIGDDVVVKVLGVDGNKVRVGIQAPPSVEVDRAELRERKEQDGRISRTPGRSK